MSVLSHRRAGGTYLLSAFLILAIATLGLCSLFVGRYTVSPEAVFRIIIHLSCKLLGWEDHPQGFSEMQAVVIGNIRLPRIAMAIMTGMSLAICGAALQGVFRNPLVGPEIVGVSHGACFGGVLGILAGFTSLGIICSAMAGGFSALILCFFLAQFVGGKSALSVVLTGVIVSGFFAAAVSVVQYVADPDVQLPAIVYWLLGSFANANARGVITITIAFCTCGLILSRLSWRINLLSLGDADAEALGVKVFRLRWCIVALVSAIVGAQVSISGNIGWIGLVVPHIARMMSGPDHRSLLPVSALIGGIYMLVVDDLARSLSEEEIPIGLVSALLGTPIFAILLARRSGSRGWREE